MSEVLVQVGTDLSTLDFGKLNTWLRESYLLIEEPVRTQVEQYIEARKLGNVFEEAIVQEKSEDCIQYWKSKRRSY